MTAYERTPFECDDDIILFMLGLSPQRALPITRLHCDSLRDRSAVAATAGVIDEAIWYNEREYAVVCKAFGANHEPARNTFQRLQQLRTRADAR